MEELVQRLLKTWFHNKFGFLVETVELDDEHIGYIEVDLEEIEEDLQNSSYSEHINEDYADSLARLLGYDTETPDEEYSHTQYINNLFNSLFTDLGRENS